jgi:hypothetical protein
MLELLLVTSALVRLCSCLVTLCTAATKLSSPQLSAPLTFTVAYYAQLVVTIRWYSTTSTAFVYGSEFKKGTNGMAGSLEAEDSIFDNSPIIIKDNYEVSGSDMAQIGWVEVTTENGATGYLWYIKSEHETRLRFEDYLEMSMIEGVPAESASGAIAVYR